MGSEIRKKIRDAMKSYVPPSLEEMVADGQRLFNEFPPTEEEIALGAAQGPSDDDDLEDYTAARQAMTADDEEN